MYCSTPQCGHSASPGWEGNLTSCRHCRHGRMTDAMGRTYVRDVSPSRAEVWRTARAANPVGLASLMTRVAIYTRLSRDPDGTQTATARQEAACRTFAELRDREVADVYEDVDV